MTQYDDETSPSDAYDAPVDAKQAQDIAKRNAKQAGDYWTDPEQFGAFTDSVLKADDGRVSVSFFGRANFTKRGQEPITNGLRFKVSNQPRPKKLYENGQEVGVDENKDDLQTRLYAEAVQVYLQVHNEPPKTFRQVVEFLKEGSYGLNTMLGSDGDLVVLHVKAPRRK